MLAANSTDQYSHNLNTITSKENPGSSKIQYIYITIYKECQNNKVKTSDPLIPIRRGSLYHIPHAERTKFKTNM
jgi:hypothetical protein